MSIFIGTASDYSTLQKESLSKRAKVKDWEEFLTSQPAVQNIQSAYETQRQDIVGQANYDISSAYANYKRNEMTALQNAKLGSGFREQIASELGASFGKQRQDIQRQEAQGLAKTYQEEVKDLQSVYGEYEKELGSRAENLQKIEKLAYDYGQIKDLKLLNQSIGAGGYGFYTTNEKGETTITNTGREFFNKLLNTPGFAEHVYESDPELYEYYSTNIGDVRELIGGIDRESGKYEANKYLSTSEEYANKIASAKNRLGANFENLVFDVELVGGADKKVKFKTQDGNEYTLQANRRDKNKSEKLSERFPTAQPGEIIKDDDEYFIKIEDRWWRIKDDLPWIQKPQVAKTSFWDNLKSNGIQSPSI